MERARSGRLISSLRPRSSSLSARNRHPRPTIIQLAATASMAALQAVARSARSATPTMDPASALTDLGAYRNDGQDHEPADQHLTAAHSRPRAVPSLHREPCRSHPCKRPPTRPDGSRQQPWAKPERRNGFEQPCGGLLMPTDQKVPVSSYDSNGIIRSANLRHRHPRPGRSGRALTWPLSELMPLSELIRKRSEIQVLAGPPSSATSGPTFSQSLALPFIGSAAVKWPDSCHCRPIRRRTTGSRAGSWRRPAGYGRLRLSVDECG